MNRRGIFGLAAGAGAAVVTGGGRNARNVHQLPPPTGRFWAGSQTGMDCAAEYVESAARAMLNKRIEDTSRAHERCIRRLNRLKSVSQAFVDSQYAGHGSLIDSLYKQLSEAR